jgi:hypothetical protein
MCDRKFQVNYLVKYISGKEEHQVVNVAATKDMTEVGLTTEGHAHEKITGCNLVNKTKEGANTGREICLAELVWFLLGLPYTYCNAEFAQVSTLPLESRVGVRRQFKRVSKLLSGECVDDIGAVRGRLIAGLPDWRRFSDDQLVHIEDYRTSPYWCDLTSSFNVRPPELVMFDDLQLYCECFVADGTQECDFEVDVGKQLWLDGLSRRILLRSCSVRKAVDFVTSKAESGDIRAAEMLEAVFDPIGRGDPDFVQRFVQETDAQQVVSVISLVKPFDRTKFLSHLCMSLGRYRSEVDLFCNGAMTTAFIKAGLLPNTSSFTRADVLSILCRYILEDLRFHPISARQFAKYIKAAFTALSDLINDNVVGDQTPCVTDIMLKEQATDAVTKKEQIRRANLVAALQDDPAICNSLPDNLLTASLASPLEWKPEIVLVGNISEEAVVEQSAALDCCVKAIDRFVNVACRGVRFPCLLGRAGSGKSHVLKLGLAYALSKGLQCELLSFTSERARKLGGSHMHLVFPFGVNHSRVSFTHDLVASCMASLDKDQMKMSMLKRTDVFIFEELGLLSAEYFSALDNVLRLIMDNSSPMGGKLFISCGDSKQLPPIDGRPIWASLNMCTMMHVFKFSCDVRAREDEILQQLNSDCRRTLTSDECKAVADTILRECRFEKDWSTVPDIAVRIVPTKAAEAKVMTEFLRNRETKSYTAIDQVQNGALWERATERITAILNKNCYEYDVCKLYVNAVVRMTYNRRQDGETIFSQGQVAVVVALPDDTKEFNDQRLTLRLAPPGRRQIDPSDIDDDWRQVVVPPRCTLPILVGKGLQMGRRFQFPVRYYLASTCHRIQGDTVPLLATEMSSSRKEYKMWQREQFAVLISRVQRCQDIIFVGNPAETRIAIEKIMRRTSKWDALIEHYLTELNVAVHRDGARRLALDVHPFLPIYRELPAAGCTCAYMLVSLSSVARCYIGQTTDLRRTLNKHNTGFGVPETSNTALQPWGVYAFVYGFEDNTDDDGRQSRVQFAAEWAEAMRIPNQNPALVYGIGEKITDKWVRNYAYKLTIVKCGQYTVSAGEQQRTIATLARLQF